MQLKTGPLLQIADDAEQIARLLNQGARRIGVLSAKINQTPHQTQHYTFAIAPHLPQ